MTIPGRDDAVEVLREDECRRLLASASIGRIGFSQGALPAVLPVPYVVHEDRLLIPAVRDSTVVPALRGAVVALLVDSFGGDPGSGWGVTVVGPTHVIGSPEQVAALDGLRLFTGPPPPGHCYIAVRPSLLRGWRTCSDTSEA
jgi:hypothetical protein